MTISTQIEFTILLLWSLAGIVAWLAFQTNKRLMRLEARLTRHLVDEKIAKMHLGETYTGSNQTGDPK